MEDKNLDFLNFLEDNDEIITKVAKENSYQEENGKWYPNWTKETIK